MRADIVAVIVTASSCLITAKARGRRGGGGGWSGNSSLVSVGGYTRRDGTHVAPYVRARADGDPANDLSQCGDGVMPVETYQRTESINPAAAVAVLPQPVASMPPMPGARTAPSSAASALSTNGLHPAFAKDGAGNCKQTVRAACKADFALATSAASTQTES